MDFKKLLLQVFSLDKYTETKVPERTLDIIFEKETQLLGKENGQQKCKDLKFPFSRSPLIDIPIKNSKNLLARDDEIKGITEITLEGKDFKEFDWQPGDTIAILPNNANEDVDELLMLLEMDDKADTVCSVRISQSCSKKTAKVPTYIPSQTTPREILRDCLDLRILKKSFIRSLAEYCTDNVEIEFLKSMSSKEGSSNFGAFILYNRYTIIDILRDCQTCKPPFSLIVEHLTRLLPRPYSIASSPLKTKDKITFIFSVYASKPGVTTKMLQEKCSQESASLLMYLRESNSFRYTEDNYKQNQILISIGTGLAPFLGFLQHKYHIMINEENKEKQSGITWLFAAATKQESIIHRGELLDWQSKVLDNFLECYSRTPSPHNFHYIQEAIEHFGHQLIELLMKPETCLYLCADGGKISKSIEMCLLNVLSKELAISEAESNNMLTDFKTKGKYKEDIWN